MGEVRLEDIEDFVGNIKPPDTVGEPTSMLQDRFFLRKLPQLFCL